jgi:DNA-binding transcriptional regulator YhcF (GntR family)
MGLFFYHLFFRNQRISEDKIMTDTKSGKQYFKKTVYTDLIRSKAISVHAKIVYCELNSNDKKFHPARSLIAKRTNLCIPTVDKALNELEQMNIITITRSKKNNRPEKNNYQLNEPDQWKSDVFFQNSGTPTENDPTNNNPRETKDEKPEDNQEESYEDQKIEFSENLNEAIRNS